MGVSAFSLREGVREREKERKRERERTRQRRRERETEGERERERERSKLTFVFAVQFSGLPPSSIVCSPSLYPNTPPWAFLCWKAARIPARTAAPYAAQGPLRATDCPKRRSVGREAGSLKHGVEEKE